MKFEMNRPVDENFYREVVNVCMQYKRIIKKPGSLIADSMAANKRNLILYPCVLGVLILAGVFMGFNIDFLILITICLFMELLTFYISKTAKNQFKSLMATAGEPATVVFDDGGIEFQPSDDVAYRLSWSKIALVKLTDLGIYFIPQEKGQMLIALERKYYNEIKPYIYADIH